jgi:2-oxoacid:acceptor oxidoreductase gamma subunit (pyruvate/2-ketoisovalerate family)
LDGRIAAVLDAGPTGGGVESTVLDLSNGVYRVLRRGGIGIEALQEVLQQEIEIADPKFHHFQIKLKIMVAKEQDQLIAMVDESLLDSVDVTGGMKEGGAIIINTPSSPEEMRPRLRGWTGKVCTIDARRISEENLGANFPNTPMLAAAVKVSGVLEIERFLADMEESFKHKFASKPQVIEGNMATLKKSMEEVQVG